MSSQANVAYGGLNMVENEKPESMLHQIHELSKKRPAAWFFDILHKPADLGVAWSMADYCKRAIKAENPDLEDKNIVVHTNVPGLAGPGLLKARNEMFKRIHEGSAKEVKFKDGSDREFKA